MKKRKVRLGEAFELKITKANIRAGARLSEGWCPIALALRRRFPNANVCVRPKDTDIKRGNYRIIYKNPPAARHFITRFDNGQLVEPCVIRFKAS